METVRVEMRGHVADVQLDRREKLNALDAGMYEAIVEVGTALGRDPAVRAVVISGAGRAFCAGLDFSRFSRMEHQPDGAADDLLRREQGEPWNFSQKAAWIWRAIPAPVIAAVHGVAYGAGLQIALGADLRLVAPDARLSFREVVWGLVPDMGASQLTRSNVRLDHLRELVYTGRAVSGHEAVALGLATRVADPPREAALELAQEIAARSPSAVQAAKAILNEAPFVSLAQGLRLEETHARRLVGSDEQREAVRANLAERPTGTRIAD
jgi:enoyl-CoA hydratase/carnithine racemase